MESSVWPSRERVNRSGRQSRRPEEILAQSCESQGRWSIASRTLREFRPRFEKWVWQTTGLRTPSPRGRQTEQ